jgi:hypothetical protein
LGTFLRLPQSLDHRKGGVSPNLNTIIKKAALDYVLLQPLLFFERGVFMSVMEEWLMIKTWKGKNSV